MCPIGRTREGVRPCDNRFERKTRDESVLMAVANSIYDYIASSMVDEELPDDFSLTPFFRKRESSPFAAGARDGVCLYHEMPVVVSEDGEAVVARAFSSLSEQEGVLLARRNRERSLADAVFPFIRRRGFLRLCAIAPVRNARSPSL